MADEVLRLRVARSVELMIPAIGIDESGRVVKFDLTDKVFWIRYATDTLAQTPEILTQENVILKLPGSEIRAATQEEIDALPADAQNSDVTWLKAFLPGGEKRTDFASIKRTFLMIFEGPVEGGIVYNPIISSFEIDRVIIGAEGVFDTSGSLIGDADLVVSS